MKSNLYNEKFSFGTVFVQESNIFQVVRKKVGKSKSKQSLSKKANNGKQIKVKSAWDLFISSTSLIYTQGPGRRNNEKLHTDNMGFEWRLTNCFGATLLNCENVMLNRGKAGIADHLWKMDGVGRYSEKSSNLEAGKVSNLCLSSTIAPSPSCLSICVL